MDSYLVYHPLRVQFVAGNITVYHDRFGGNEDPYIWNETFLHTFCHITQMKNDIGQINFWVSGDTFPNFSELLCDCVFKVAHKLHWDDSNFINRNNPMIDNDQVYEHHYQWAHQHPFKKKRRYTLKADPERSFQPQTSNGVLFDILPFLNANGISTNHLIQAMTSSRGSRPFKLNQTLGTSLYNHINTQAAIKIYGVSIQHLHP